MKTSIDLFAGCGGLSLGLEEAGFETIYVNELNRDAMNSFLKNREENPYLKNPDNRLYDLVELTQDPEELNKLRKRLHKEFGEIDIVSGGPPCQGYSGIGHRSTFKELNTRKEAIPTNHLYKEMAKFIEVLAPRAFIFENVRGLLSAKKTAQGHKGEFWEDIQKEFKDIRATPPGKQKPLNYVVQWKLLYAKDYGVPQNRPRVIMIGIRKDVHEQLPSEIKQNQKDSFYPLKTDRFPDPIDVLGDLIDDHYEGGGATRKYPKEADKKNKYQKELRRKSRNGAISKKGDKLTDHEYSKHSLNVVRKFEKLIKAGRPILGSEEKKKANKRCERYIQYANKVEKLKIRFVEDFYPLLTEDELLKLRHDCRKVKETERYIKVLEKVEKRVIKHIGTEPDTKWVTAKEEKRENIKNNLRKLKSDKKNAHTLLEEYVQAGKCKARDFDPLPISRENQWERIVDVTELIKKIEEQVNGLPASKKWETLSPEDQDHVKHNLRKIQEKKKYQSKFGQRPLPKRWGEGGPNITITGGTEDLIHFSQPRTLTVRESARLQGFPDWYEFAGHRTTGGRRRAGKVNLGDWTRDLPKYTQIGNAVPVKLAKALGLHLKTLLETDC